MRSSWQKGSTGCGFKYVAESLENETDAGVRMMPWWTQTGEQQHILFVQERYLSLDCIGRNQSVVFKSSSTYEKSLTLGGSPPMIFRWLPPPNFFIFSSSEVRTMTEARQGFTNLQIALMAMGQWGVCAAAFMLFKKGGLACFSLLHSRRQLRQMRREKRLEEKKRLEEAASQRSVVASAGEIAMESALYAHKRPKKANPEEGDTSSDEGNDQVDEGDTVNRRVHDAFRVLVK